MDTSGLAFAIPFIQCPHCDEMTLEDEASEIRVEGEYIYKCPKCGEYLRQA